MRGAVSRVISIFLSPYSLMAGIYGVADWTDRHASYLLRFPCREPPVLAHMHGFPTEHWLCRDPILDVRIVSQQGRHNPTRVQNTIQERAPASRTCQPHGLAGGGESFRRLAMRSRSLRSITLMTVMSLASMR